MLRRAGISLLLAPVLCAGAAVAAPDFEREVRSILAERCVECHGPKKQKGGLRLDAKVFALKGGDNGPVLAREENELLRRVRSHDEDEVMPPKGARLTAAQIALLEGW